MMESCCLDRTFVLKAAVPGGYHCYDEATVQALCPPVVLLVFTVSLSCGKSLFLPVILVIQVLLFNYPMFNSANLSQRRENMIIFSRVLFLIIMFLEILWCLLTIGKTDASAKRCSFPECSRNVDTRRCDGLAVFLCIASDNI